MLAAGSEPKQRLAKEENARSMSLLILLWWWSSASSSFVTSAANCVGGEGVCCGAQQMIEMASGCCNRRPPLPWPISWLSSSAFPHPCPWARRPLLELIHVTIMMQYWAAPRWKARSSLCCWASFASRPSSVARRGAMVIQQNSGRL